MTKGIIYLLIIFSSFNTYAQNVGIGTNAPQARLHVSDSSVVFTGGPWNMPNPVGNPPVTGNGTRMMWYADKAAFRVGAVNTNNWDKDSIGYYSFATGFNTKAMNHYTTSMGLETRASGTASTSMGGLTTASGNYSTSFGFIGTASGSASTSMGSGTQASGNTSTSMGNNTHASGYYSTTMGYLTTASGVASTSMGFNNTSSGDHSTTMGRANMAKAYASLTIGTYNDNSDNPDPVSYSNSDRVFQIGNGTGPVTRGNSLTVLRNGNVGIGAINPATKLDIAGGNNWDLSNTEGDFRVGNSNYRIKMGIALDGGGSGAATIRSAGGIERLSLGANNTNLLTLNGATANVGIGTETPSQKLHVIGNILATGTIMPSDARFKKNIEPIHNSLEKIRQINGVTYYYRYTEFKDLGFTDKEQVGVIAQEVEKVLPQLVFTDDKGYKAVDYTKLVPLLIEGIKEQQKQIETSKDEVEKLKQQVAELKKIVEQLVGK